MKNNRNNVIFENTRNNNIVDIIDPNIQENAFK